MTLSEACGSSTFCLQQQERDRQVMRKLKRHHYYYYQIQYQLYCIDKEWCDFVLRTDKDLHIEQIYRDRTWLEQQLQKLIGGSLGKLHYSRSCRQQGLASSPRKYIRVFALLLHNSTSYAITDNDIHIQWHRVSRYDVQISTYIHTYRHRLRSTPYLAIIQHTVLISVCLHCTVYVSVSMIEQN